VYGKTGQVDDGLAALDEAFTAVTDHRICFNEAELDRLRAELLAQRGDVPGAEASFNRALDVARRQRARSLELRAATSLGRLWQSQGKSAAARDALVGIYGWFTEGFDTADLQAARAVFEGVSGKPAEPERRG
jgi:tetratricopeptide (TPR) repeat protein